MDCFDFVDGVCGGGKWRGDVWDENAARGSDWRMDERAVFADVRSGSGDICLCGFGFSMFVIYRANDAERGREGA